MTHRDPIHRRDIVKDNMVGITSVDTDMIDTMIGKRVAEIIGNQDHLQDHLGNQVEDHQDNLPDQTVEDHLGEGHQGPPIRG